MPLQQLGPPKLRTRPLEFVTSQRCGHRAATCATSETLSLTGTVTRTGGVITEESSLENEARYPRFLFQIAKKTLKVNSTYERQLSNT